MIRTLYRLQNRTNAVEISNYFLCIVLPGPLISISKFCVYRNSGIEGIHTTYCPLTSG